MEAGDNDKVADLAGSGVVGRDSANGESPTVTSGEGEDDPRKAYPIWAEKT